MLKQKGYATGMVGKWHLGRPPEFLPLRRGFDEFFGLPYSNDQWPLNPDKPGAFPPLPLIEGEKVVNPALTHRDMEQLTSQYTERAVSFIERNKERPFFLYVAHTMPHVPLAVSDKFRGTTPRGLYGDAVEEIDWSTGEILATLKKLGLENDTLIMFTSDNGPWLLFGNHAGSAYPLREGKTTTWDGGTRVPFIACWPHHIREGAICTEMAMAIDLLPTIANLIGAKLPDRKIDGLDIWPLLAGQKDAKNPHEAYFFYGVPFGSWTGAELESVRNSAWKLILPHTYRTMGDSKPEMDGWPGVYQKRLIREPELYSMTGDIEERHNVAAQHPDVVKKLLSLAEKCRDDLGDSATNRKGRGIRAPGRLPEE
jgi:arylsulfatase A-like enzyme